MSILKCKRCESDLELLEGGTGKCGACGTLQTVPTGDNEKKLTLFAQADRLRRECEFDKASEIYEAITAEFPEEPEAYWGLVLCRYGIEYVYNPTLQKPVPHIRKGQTDLIFSNVNYKSAIEKAKPAQKAIYEEEAKTINEIQKVSRYTEMKEKAKSLDQSNREGKQNRIRDMLQEKRSILIKIGIGIAAVLLLIFFINLPVTIKYIKANVLKWRGEYNDALALFEELDGYWNSEKQILDCKYRDGVALMEEGKYVEAYESLMKYAGYKDGIDKARSIFDDYKTEKLKNLKVDDVVFFGTYEQDKNTNNGKEGIEWLVLEVKDGKALLLSKYIVDYKKYHDVPYNSISWQSCSLNQWLNDKFLQTAFSVKEMAMISDDNSGGAPDEQVFLLSIFEAEKYFSSHSERECKEAYYNPSDNYIDPHSNWWLRGAYVNRSGEIMKEQSDVILFTDTVYGVRPAMWIDLND